MALVKIILLALHVDVTLRGGRWGLLESEKPNKKPIKTEKPQ
jgi:hypothetical protein